MDNLILDISDSKEVFIENFTKVYTLLGNTDESFPIVYGDHIIYFSKKCNAPQIKEYIEKNTTLENIIIVFSKRRLYFADFSLENLIYNVYTLLNYYLKTVDINSKNYAVNFDELNISFYYAKYVQVYL